MRRGGHLDIVPPGRRGYSHDLGKLCGEIIRPVMSLYFLQSFGSSSSSGKKSVARHCVGVSQITYSLKKCSWCSPWRRGIGGPGSVHPPPFSLSSNQYFCQSILSVTLSSWYLVYISSVFVGSFQQSLPYCLHRVRSVFDFNHVMQTRCPPRRSPRKSLLLVRCPWENYVPHYKTHDWVGLRHLTKHNSLSKAYCRADS